MKRKKRIVIIAHCILNANSKVEGLSQYESMIKSLIDYLHKNSIGIIQLPCPEMHVLGIKRWEHVKEQFETRHFQLACKDLLAPTHHQIIDYMNHGYNVIGVIGIDGSPSCGVDETCSANWGQSFDCYKNLEGLANKVSMTEGSGVFMETFKKLLIEGEKDLDFIGINEKNPTKSLERIFRWIDSKLDK